MYTSINQIRRAFWLSRSWKGFQGWDCRSYPSEIVKAFHSFLGNPPGIIVKYITL